MRVLFVKLLYYVMDYHLFLFIVKDFIISAHAVQRFSLVAESGGLLFIAVLELLIAVASLVAEHRL